jgi:peptidyl-prolyl cis-trans isomerase A (cyclophilin A)
VDSLPQRWRVRLLGGLAGLLLVSSGPPAVAAEIEQVRIRTDLGDLLLRLEPERAPVTTANFLRHVRLHGYADASFYRVVRPDNQPDDSVRIDVIQGGLGFAGEAPLPPIAHETTAETGLAHLDGTLSMARREPGTAASEFFICIGPQPELDFGGRRNPDGQGFAAFGRVIEGMDLVRAIQQRETRTEGDARERFGSQMLATPVRILGIDRIPPTADAVAP